MKIDEMFPTKPEQTIAQRIIEVLQKFPDSNVVEIVDKLWVQKTQTSKTGANPLVYNIMKNLQSLNIVTCRIEPKLTSYFDSDHFALTDKSEEALNELYRLHIAKRYKPQLNKGPRYVVFSCSNCIKVIGARSSQKNATCIYCNCKNPLDEKLKVWLRTDDKNEVKLAIQKAKQHQNME